MVEKIIAYLLENDLSPGAEEDFGDDDWKDVIVGSDDMAEPNWYRSLPVGTDFKTRDGAVVKKLDDVNILDQGQERVLNNPGYLCYPVGWDIGKIKSFSRSWHKVPRLREAEEDFEDLDASDAREVQDVDAHTLDDIKAAEPEFFSRKTNKFFGTKKIYQYGHFLVLKNRRKRMGHFGNIDYHTSFEIYEFLKTNDTPQGLLLHRGSAGDLPSAKEMIKLKDYRSRYERARDMLAQAGKPVAEGVEPQVVPLSPEEAKEAYYDTSEMEQFPIKRLSVPGSFLDFEESDQGIWILNLVTEPEFKRRGLATQLLRYIYNHALTTGKSVFHGSYTDDGEKYIKPVVQRMWPTTEALEDEDDDFEADQAKEIGTMSDLSAWQEHDVLRATDKFALVRFQNGLAGLVCRIPNHRPDRVRVKDDKDLDYLMSLSNDSFNMSAVFEFGCGVWQVRNGEDEEEMAEQEREFDGG